jgi:hypothetical protein
MPLNLKCRVDPRATHLADIATAEMEIKKLEKKRPHDYFLTDRYAELAEIIRLANMRIKFINRQIADGAKF